MGTDRNSRHSGGKLLRGAAEDFYESKLKREQLASDNTSQRAGVCRGSDLGCNISVVLNALVVNRKSGNVTGAASR
jgi:hypothetical protein